MTIFLVGGAKFKQINSKIFSNEYIYFRTLCAFSYFNKSLKHSKTCLLTHSRVNPYILLHAIAETEQPEYETAFDRMGKTHYRPLCDGLSNLRTFSHMYKKNFMEMQIKSIKPIFQHLQVD